MPHDLTRITTVIAVTLVMALFPASKVTAQETSSVEIDMSVLGAIDPSAGKSEPITPAPAQYKTERDPYLTRGATRPGRVSKPVEDYKAPVAPTPAAAAKPTPRAIKHFDIQVKDRTESFDPSIPMQEADIKEPARHKTTVYQPPLPALKPVAIPAAQAEVQAMEIRTTKVPIPPRRPHIQQASASFVAKAKKELKPAGITVKNEMSMPAVPAEKVVQEQLLPASGYEVAHNDELGQVLVTPDKQTMVETIEAMGHFIDTYAKAHQQAAYYEGDDLGLNGKDAPVPVKKPDYEDKLAASIDKAVAASKIEPAAGIQQSSVELVRTDAEILEKPYTPLEAPHELEYISMPFEAKTTGLDKETEESIEKRIVPLLRSNPQWRLQIQSFASKTEEQLGNARRKSLSRALAIRTYLMDKGIEARRMDVRALGMQTDRNPADRVDFVFFDPQY